MKDITNNLKKPDVWKIQLTIPTSIYQIGLETSVMGSGFIFDRFNFIKINLKRGGSYIDFLNMAKHQKAKKMISMMMITAFNTMQQSH